MPRRGVQGAQPLGNFRAYSLYKRERTLRFHSEPRTLALNMLSEWTIFTREVAIFSHRHRHPGKKKISKKKATVTQASQVVPHPSTD